MKPEFKAKNIQSAGNKLNILNMSDEERRAFEKYLMNKASERDVIETAKIESKIEITKNMLAKGIEISLISEITELSEEEIQKLKS